MLSDILFHVLFFQKSLLIFICGWLLSSLFILLHHLLLLLFNCSLWNCRRWLSLGGRCRFVFGGLCTCKGILLWSFGGDVIKRMWRNRKLVLVCPLLSALIWWLQATFGWLQFTLFWRLVDHFLIVFLLIIIRPFRLSSLSASYGDIWLVWLDLAVIFRLLRLHWRSHF